MMILSFVLVCSCYTGFHLHCYLSCHKFSPQHLQQSVTISIISLFPSEAACAHSQKPKRPLFHLPPYYRLLAQCQAQSRHSTTTCPVRLCLLHRGICAFLEGNHISPAAPALHTDEKRAVGSLPLWTDGLRATGAP